MLPTYSLLYKAFAVWSKILATVDWLNSDLQELQRIPRVRAALLLHIPAGNEHIFGGISGGPGCVPVWRRLCPRNLIVEEFGTHHLSLSSIDVAERTATFLLHGMSTSAKEMAQKKFREMETALRRVQIKFSNELFARHDRSEFVRSGRSAFLVYYLRPVEDYQ